MNNLNSLNDILNSKNIANRCDFIYSQKVSVEEYEGLKNKENTTIIEKTSHKDYKTVLYKKNKFTLKENDVIYCNSELVEDFFSVIKNNQSIKNLFLITGQSDRKITQSLFSLKPDSVFKWYSINVDHDDNNLIPIPLGIADSFSKKNLNVKNIFNNIDFKYGNKENKIYLNFRLNTNFFHRRKLYKIFRNKKWTKLQETDISNSDYLNDMKKYNFTLCPWGNGIDTHRLWEAIYNGSIPITIKHKTYSNLEGLPILQVDSYKQLNKDFLDKSLKEVKKRVDVSKLNVDSIFDSIAEFKTDNLTKDILFYEDEMKVKENLNYFNERNKKISKKKKYQTLFRKIYIKIFSV
tara:strand:- start:17 stop:1066 length:1050 start_codon:yes stop_codon:yes gene_type:complete